MERQEIELFFPAVLKNEPVMYHVIKNYDVITVIKEASFTPELGWAVMEFEGSDEKVKAVLNFLASKGVRVEPKK